MGNAKVTLSYRKMKLIGSFNVILTFIISEDDIAKNFLMLMHIFLCTIDYVRKF